MGICAGKCGADIASHLLMCSAEWYKVPKVLRDEVYRTHRNMNRHDGPGLDEVLAEYETARAAAIASLEDAA